MTYQNLNQVNDFSIKQWHCTHAKALEDISIQNMFYIRDNEI